MPSTTQLHIDYIPVLKDNYIWAVSLNPTPDSPNKTNSGVIVVDPGDGDAVVSYLEKTNQRLAAIFITHSHWDHIGGVNTLTNNDSIWLAPNNKAVYGHSSIKCVNISVSHGQKIMPWNTQDISFDVIATPGHMPEHMSYYVSSIDHMNHLSIHNKTALFCGDTLFHTGCGRIFNGTAQELYTSLKVLSELDENTQIYCTHEYTQNNIEFALTIEPDNEILINESQRVTTLRRQNKITLPTNIHIQKAINPFLRCAQPKIQKKVLQLSNQKKSLREKTDNAVKIEDTFRLLRELKDAF